MHDLDRTYLEDTEGLEHADGEYGDHGEDEHDDHGEDEDREAQGHEGGEIFHEDEVTEMAAQLLGASSESELDHFLGDFLRKAGDLAGKLLSSSQGKALGGILKGVARSAVPALASAIAPGVGGAIASALGFELEGLSPEDQEFEAAKQLIRLGAEAVRQAAGAPPGADPRAVAEAAMTRAAQQFAPGLLRGALPEGAPSLSAESGRWTRRGRHIILHGVY
jgi:hypothetical protein